MACNFPKIFNGVLCPCGKCAGCRRSMRSVWTTRAILESYQYDPKTNYFITLTYSDEFCPTNGQLQKRDFQLFIKRLRKRCGCLRYFGCGEYGKKSMRPHYHAIIYGFTGSKDDIEKCWNQGFVFVGTVTPQSCAYVSKYITKRYDADWRKELESSGRCPEFSLMSRRPGLGFGAVEGIVKELKSAISRNVNTGVPTVLRIGGRFLVLGRYLRQKIEEALGFTDEQREARFRQLQAEMHIVLMDYYGVAKHPLSDYFSAPAVDKALRYLKSLERSDREYVHKQLEAGFVDKL